MKEDILSTEEYLSQLDESNVIFILQRTYREFMSYCI